MIKDLLYLFSVISGSRQEHPIRNSEYAVRINRHKLCRPKTEKANLNVKILSALLEPGSLGHAGDNVDDVGLEGEGRPIIVLLLVGLVLEKGEEELELLSRDGVLPQHLDKTKCFF